MENEDINLVKGVVVSVKEPYVISTGTNNRGPYTMWGASVKISNHEGVREYRTKTFFDKPKLEKMLTAAKPNSTVMLGLVLNDRNYQDIVSIEAVKSDPQSVPQQQNPAMANPQFFRDKDKLILSQVALKSAVEFAKTKPKISPEETLVVADLFEHWLFERLGDDKQ